MRKYPEENWKALGRWLHDARMEYLEYREMRRFADVVGRSTRQLQGLERGEPVGVKTLEAVSAALGIASWYVLGRLADPALESGGLLTREQVGALRAEHAAESTEPDLTTVSNAALLNELRRRIEEPWHSVPTKDQDGGTQDAGQAEAKKSGVIPFPSRQQIEDAAADSDPET